MELYIKGYYGYQNFGDELLLLGLINFFVNRYKPTCIYIESGNKDFLSSRISKNQSYINYDISQIQITTKRQYISQYYRFRNCHKIIGGGECISPVAKFPNGGWMYIARFGLDIMRSNYSICGGIGTPNSSSKLLYKILLWRAKSIIVRDLESQNIGLIYNNKTKLYHDFAIDIINIYQNKKNNLTDKSIIKNKYILLNLKKSEYNQENLSLIKNFIQKYPNHKYIYFANFIGEDDDISELLAKDLGIKIQNYDRKDKNLDEILGLFDMSDGGWGVRLHFLLVLKMLGKNYEYIYYQEKIKKIIG